MLAKSVVSALMLAAATTVATGQDAADVAAGKRLAGINCAKCHALHAAGASPFPAALPFRDIARNYDEGELEDAFNDGIVATHPAMPDWEMTPDQARTLAAYIMSFANAP